jgi:hypothetical protein
MRKKEAAEFLKIRRLFEMNYEKIRSKKSYFAENPNRWFYQISLWAAEIKKGHEIVALIETLAANFKKDWQQARRPDRQAKIAQEFQEAKREGPMPTPAEDLGASLNTIFQEIELILEVVAVHSFREGELKYIEDNIRLTRAKNNSHAKQKRLRFLQERKVTVEINTRRDC